MNGPTALLLPEIILAATAVAIYMGGAFFASRTVWRWVALAGVVLAGAALAADLGRAAPGDPLSIEPFAWYGRWLSLGAGALFVLLAWRPLDLEGTPEYLGSLLLMVAGLMLVAETLDLVILFVGLELVSIPTYILLYLGRQDPASQESTAKYFYLSILASALLLYGFSFLYGLSGSTDLEVIAGRIDALQGSGLFPLAKVALVLVLAGLGFRITAVPFHFYAPDVYQGTTHPNAALLSVLPKIAGLAAMVEIVAVAMHGLESYAWPIVMVLSILTMTLGNAAALWQTNLRRLMAYSSIAHAGYLLVGLAVYLASGLHGPESWDGVGALLFYLVVYAVGTIGTFAVLAALGAGEGHSERIDDLGGLAWSGGIVRPVLAVALAVFMFSLAGLPPLAGFWGKLALFASALDLGPGGQGRPWFVLLAVLGVLNSVVSAGYYLRIVGVMFFRSAEGRRDANESAGGAFWAVVACLVLAMGIGIRPGPWIREAHRASPGAIAVQRGIPRALADGSQ